VAEPTLVDYQQSTWADTTSASEVTPSISWQTGDIILVVGATEDSGVTFNTPTATGLTFSLLTSTGGASNTATYMWSATAGSNGSGAVTATHNGGASYAKGISAFVFRGSDGLGTAQTITGTTAKTISLTRAQANSHAVCVPADWNQVGDASIDPTPGTNAAERVEAQVSGRADFILYSWGDQGATGTTSYGVTNHTGTVDMSGIVVEITGTAGAATSLPIPSRPNMGAMLHF